DGPGGLDAGFALTGGGVCGSVHLAFLSSEGRPRAGSVGSARRPKLVSSPVCLFSVWRGGNLLPPAPVSRPPSRSPGSERQVFKDRLPSLMTQSLYTQLSVYVKWVFTIFSRFLGLSQTLIWRILHLGANRSQGE